MSDNEDKQIMDLKMRFSETIDTAVRNSVIDVLSTHGNKGVDAIIELIGATVNNDVKAHGLGVINRIRSNTSLDLGN